MVKVDVVHFVRVDLGGSEIVISGLPADLVDSLVDEIKATITFYKNLWGKDEKGKV